MTLIVNKIVKFREMANEKSVSFEDYADNTSVLDF